VNLSSQNSGGPTEQTSRYSGWTAVFRDPARAPLILVVATFLFLAPFLTRAFNIDEPLFVWSAQQIQQRPLDPYGFKVNWYMTLKPMWIITKNPPLASYYLASAAAVLGWSEVALHLAFLLPAMGAVLGTYYVARSLCGRPLLAALATLAAPVFLLSSATVMCDTLMLAFWIWAIYLWREGIERNRAGWLALAGLFIGAAALTKYFAISLIPLLAACTFWKRRRLDASFCWLLIPAAMIAVYDAAGRHLYGRSLVLDAGEYAGAVKKLTAMGTSGVGKLLIGLGFAGGGLMAPLLLCPLLKPSRRALAAGVALVVAGAWAVDRLIRPEYAAPPPVISNGALILHWCVYASAGIVVLWLAGSDLRRNRDEPALLLFLWVVGTLIFACLINWSVNGRSVLPLAPAVAILLARRLDHTANVTTAGLGPFRWLAPLGICAAIALGVTQADASLANSARRAAVEIALMKTNASSTLWFSGHWGFQFYMEKAGAKCVNFSEANFATNDLMALPSNNANVVPPPIEAVEVIRTMPARAGAWIATHNPLMYAGFYSSEFGPLPYCWGAVPPESYQVVRFKIPVSGRMD
jgi:hypothetical protein